jgi:ring-1,2-phenylacetyl-CoA epoxidase subunit PaaC
MTNPNLFPLALRLADDALVLGHRLSEWSSQAPMLEEDIALSNLGLDLIGQARLFYALAGDAEAKGRDEDQLAYFRDADAYRNIQLVELPNGDFAHTMLRQFFFASFMHPYFAELAQSTEPRLAEIGAKAVKEMAYHVRHAAEWVIRLGDGTDESHRRMVTALDDLWGFTGELFEVPPDERALVAVKAVPDRAALKPHWDGHVARILSEATLSVPKPRSMQSGGRSGRHTEFLSKMLADMQVLARAHPTAKW